MTHFAFQPSGPRLELEADYLVVGSGAGGASAAVSLARGGAKVIVVEAGPWLDPPDYPVSTLGAMRDLFDTWGTTVTRGRALWPVVQASAVGGTTVINSAICVRTPGDIFEQWKREHGIGGEAMAESVWRYQDQIEHELSAEEVPLASLGRNNELALRGGDAMGYEHHVMRRYVRDCAGSGQCLQGCKKERKQSTNLTYLPEVLARGGQIVSCAPVERVLFERGRAVGARARFVHPKTKQKGAELRVRAKHAVLIAASATHSPALLERSGVRSPALGRYFRSHPGTGIFGLYDDPVDMNVGATQGWASTAFRRDPGFKLETLSLPLEMVASRLAGGGQQLMDRITRFRHMAFWVLAVRAESTGTVRNSWGGRPLVHYTLDRPDMERMRAGLHLIGKTHFAAGARSIIPNIYGLPFELGPDQVDLLLEAPLEPRSYTAILSHLFGGCVMGSDPSRSVCDEHGRVHGIDGLVIADASAIPSNLGVNPQHTIMGLAHLRAEELLAEQTQHPRKTA